MQIHKLLASVATLLLCVTAFGIGRSTGAGEQYASASCGSPKKDGTVKITIEETRTSDNPVTRTRKWPKTFSVPVTTSMTGATKAAAIAAAINTDPTPFTATANSNVITITADEEPPSTQGVTKVKHDDGGTKEKWSVEIQTAVGSGDLPATDPPPTTAGWIVMLGEPTGLEPDGLTLSQLEIATNRATVVYAITQDLVLHDMTRAVVELLVDHGIAATMITDGVIQITLSATLDRRLSVELTDSGLDVSHWIQSR